MTLTDRLLPLFTRAKKLVQNRWFRITIQVLILILCAVYLFTNLRSIRSSNLEIKFIFYLMAASLAITVGVVFLGALGYYLTLRAFRLPIQWNKAFNIHLQSNLAKYIPGYAWQLVGKAYLTGEAGYSIRSVSLVMVVELAQLVLTGLLTAVLCLPAGFLARFGIAINPVGWIPDLRFIGVFLLVVISLAGYWVLRQSRKLVQAREIDWMRLAGSSASMLAGWILFGFSFWLLGKALFPVTLQQLYVYVFTLSASILIGLAVVIVPASIGVRESIMVWVLGPLIGAPQAVIFAALARVIVTLSEILSAYAFKLVRPGLINPKGLDVDKDSG